jgi:hypothetical protein
VSVRFAHTLCVDVSQTEHQAQVAFRVPPDLRARLVQIAEYHGRSLSQEMRHAAMVHDCKATLAYLHTPDGSAELGDRIDQARAQVRADLTKLEHATFRRPTFGAPDD